MLRPATQGSILSVREAGRLLLHPLLSLGLHLQVGSGPSAAHQAWVLCRNTRPLSPTPWPCQSGEKRPGRSLAPHGLGTDRRRDRKLPWGSAWPVSTARDLQHLLLEGVPSGIPQGPQIKKETKANCGPKRVWSHLVAQPRGWMGDTKKGVT